MPNQRKSKLIDGPRRVIRRMKNAITLQDDDFVVNQIDGEDTNDNDEVEVRKTHSSGAIGVTQVPEAAEKVKVSFGNFAKLVSNRNFEDVIEDNKDEDVIVSSNLLADLANSNENEGERRIPAVFVVGVLMGIVITYILLTY
jgi:hypothetical protein